MILAAVNVLLAWSVYVVAMSGGLSFASGAFMAVGCYASAILTTRYGWPIHAAWFTAAILSGIAGALISLPALRVQGIYLVLVTLGVSASTVVLLENVEFLGGSMGIGGMGGTTFWRRSTGPIWPIGLMRWWPPVSAKWLPWLTFRTRSGS